MARNLRLFADKINQFYQIEITFPFFHCSLYVVEGDIIGKLKWNLCQRYWTCTSCCCEILELNGCQVAVFNTCSKMKLQSSSLRWKLRVRDGKTHINFVLKITARVHMIEKWDNRLSSSVRKLFKHWLYEPIQRKGLISGRLGVYLWILRNFC